MFVALEMNGRILDVFVFDSGSGSDFDVGAGEYGWLGCGVFHVLG